MVLVVVAVVVAVVVVLVVAVVMFVVVKYLFQQSWLLVRLVRSRSARE